MVNGIVKHTAARIGYKLRQEVVFFTALILAAATSLFVRPNFGNINLKVIASLCNLMIITLAFEKYGLLERITQAVLNRFKTEKRMGAAMVVTTAVLSMFITNDVALITVVPLPACCFCWFSTCGAARMF